MRQGRPRRPGTDAQRAAARRQQVRENVRAYRRRRAQEEDPAFQDETQDEDDIMQTDQEASSSSQSVTPHTSRHSLRSSTTLRGNQRFISPQLDITPTPEYTAHAIAGFIQRTATPDQRSDENLPANAIRLDIYNWTWVNTLATAEMRSGGGSMLEDALLACALTLLSVENSDRDMSIQGTHVHVQALRKLRQAFDNFVENRDIQNPTILSATAVLCATTELLVTKSWSDFYVHIRGAGAIIEHAGPSHLTTEYSRENFLGYRILLSSLSLLNRQSTFLSRQEWLDFPWQGRHINSECSFHRLLDIAVEVPAHLELYDTSQNRSSGEKLQQLEQIKLILSRLDDWKAAEIEKSLNNVEDTESAYWIDLGDERINFPNESSATHFTFYTGVRVSLCNLARQLAADILTADRSTQTLLEETIDQSHEWAKITIQCLEYFKKAGPFPLGKLSCLFPFDAAWDTFLELRDNYEINTTEELEWCHSTAEWMQASGLPVFKIRHQALGVPVFM